MAKKDKTSLSTGLKTGGKSLSELLYTKDKTSAAQELISEVNSNATEEKEEESINEEDYLNAKDVILPFSTILRADLYLKAKRVEYWDRLSLREILENALEEYLADKPSTNTPLPLKERKKLKPLKRPWDYRKEVGKKNKG